ncbi:MAG: hypothetical protein AABX51_09115 [Nanoarchaeota archaeon]
MNIRIQRRNLFTYAMLCILGVSLFSLVANADPEGVSIGSFSNSTRTVTNGTARTDGKGTINFVSLSTTQQNFRWKAYVGNITGTLVLQDSDGYNIYMWALSTSLSGSIIASRNNTLNWSGIKCLNSTTLTEEQNQLQFQNSQDDNIDKTFNATNHSQFSINLIPLNGCPTAYTFQNNTRQTENNSANVFQEIVIQDDVLRTAYVTGIHQDIYDYKSNASDFQMLLPDYGNLSVAATVTYYFFVELT